MNAQLKAEIEEVLNLKPLRGLTVAQALEAAKAERADREANFRYWALRGPVGRGYHTACKRIEAIEYVIAVLDAAQLPAAPVAERAPRCPFYREIRRCYAIAREAGLDTEADEAMRAAFARYLGRTVPTRETLCGADWARVANAIKGKRLAW